MSKTKEEVQEMLAEIRGTNRKVKMGDVLASLHRIEAMLARIANNTAAPHKSQQRKWSDVGGPPRG